MKYSFRARCSASGCTATMTGHVYIPDGQGDALAAAAKARGAILQTTPGIDIRSIDVKQLKPTAKKKG